MQLQTYVTLFIRGHGSGKIRTFESGVFLSASPAVAPDIPGASKRKNE